MTTGSDYEVRPEELRAVVGNVTHVLLNLYGVIQEVMSLDLAKTNYAVIGAPVSAGDIAMKAETARTLLSILRLLKQINDAAHTVANAYQQTDANVASGYGGRPTVGTGDGSIPSYSSLAVANDAMYSTRDGARPMEAVIEHLRAAGVNPFAHGNVPAWAFDSPSQFANWLDHSGQNGTGLVNVYTATTTPSAMSGRLMPGDVVVMESPAGGSHVYVTGWDGQFYNNGPVTVPDQASNVRVYRPVDATTALWR